MNTYVNLIMELSPDKRNIFRKYENLKRKIIKAKWSNVFNKTCIREDLLPNYTRILILILIFEFRGLFWHSSVPM